MADLKTSLSLSYSRSGLLKRLRNFLKSMKFPLILSMIKFISLDFLNWSRILDRVSGVSFLLPFASTSSHLLKISCIIVRFDGYFYLSSSPSFLRSWAMFSFLKRREQLSARNSSTPLFSIKSPSARFFLDVEELKHFSWISLTSTFDSLYAIDLVFFSISSLCFSTYFWIYCFLLSISHSISPVLYFWLWTWFLCFSIMALVRNYFSFKSTTRCN